MRLSVQRRRHAQGRHERSMDVLKRDVSRRARSPARPRCAADGADRRAGACAQARHLRRRRRGIISYGGEMDVAIAIRTGVVKDGTLYVRGGRGHRGGLQPRGRIGRTRSQGARGAARGRAGAARALNAPSEQARAGARRAYQRSSLGPGSAPSAAGGSMPSRIPHTPSGISGQCGQQATVAVAPASRAADGAGHARTGRRPSPSPTSRR